ncbi:hypothetical protein B0H13DRAFT_2359721 [Mycena leptocephala]|nr:hypothetical protein B0H13DRAFT_2359721 [Mycena leptocephala]
MPSTLSRDDISDPKLECARLFTVPTVIIITVAPINALLNWLLVFGPTPIRLGYIGAPIATAVSFNLVSLLSIAYGVMFLPARNRLNQKSAWHPVCRRSFQNLGILFYLGIAGAAQTASEWWAREIVALAASQISPLALATQSILIVSAATAFQGPFSIGVASSVRFVYHASSVPPYTHYDNSVGNLLGEGLADRATIAASASIVLGLLFCH